MNNTTTIEHNELAFVSRENNAAEAILPAAFRDKNLFFMRSASVAGSAGISTLGIIAFHLVAPATGANNIVVTFDTGGGTTEAVLVAQSFIYVNQTTPVGTIAESTGTAVTVTIADTDSDDQNHNLLMLGILQSEATTVLAVSSDSAPGTPTIQVQDDQTAGTDIMLAGIAMPSTTADPTPSFVMTWTNSVAFAACVLPIQTIAEVAVDFLFENGEYVHVAPSTQRLMKSSTGYQDFTPSGGNNASNAYSWMEMHGGYIFAGGYFGGTTTDDDLLKNKSGIMGTSVGGYPRVYVSGMLVSHNAAVANAQVLLVREKENVPAVAAGVQSIFRTDDSPRWGYGVVTKSFTLGDRRIFASLGGRGNTGDWNVIGGASIPIGDSFNLAGEYDGYQFNGAVAWRPGGRYGLVTLLGGYNGHAGWLAGASIAVPFSSDY